jgi:hypothetical protein
MSGNMLENLQMMQDFSAKFQSASGSSVKAANDNKDLDDFGDILEK